MNAAWPATAVAEMAPVLGSQLGQLDSLSNSFDAPGRRCNGWYHCIDRDISALLVLRPAQSFANRQCGAGDLHLCQAAVWAAIAAAGRQMTRAAGTASPVRWHARAAAQRIHFIPGLLSYSMPYTNRPSGIQPVITFDRRRSVAAGRRRPSCTG